MMCQEPSTGLTNKGLTKWSVASLPFYFQVSGPFPPHLSPEHCTLNCALAPAVQSLVDW